MSARTPNAASQTSSQTSVVRSVPTVTGRYGGSQQNHVMSGGGILYSQSSFLVLPLTLVAFIAASCSVWKHDARAHYVVPMSPQQTPWFACLCISSLPFNPGIRPRADSHHVREVEKWPELRLCRVRAARRGWSRKSAEWHISICKEYVQRWDHLQCFP